MNDTFEFRAPVGQDGKILLPPEIAAQIPSGVPVRIVLVLPDEERMDELAWMRHGIQHVFGEEDPGDALYAGADVR